MCTAMLVGIWHCCAGTNKRNDGDTIDRCVKQLILGYCTCIMAGGTAIRESAHRGSIVSSFIYRLFLPFPSFPLQSQVLMQRFLYVDFQISCPRYRRSSLWLAISNISTPSIAVPTTRRHQRPKRIYTKQWGKSGGPVN
jgi:hypothetical protein